MCEKMGKNPRNCSTSCLQERSKGLQTKGGGVIVARGSAHRISWFFSNGIGAGVPCPESLAREVRVKPGGSPKPQTPNP